VKHEARNVEDDAKRSVRGRWFQAVFWAFWMRSGEQGAEARVAE
jgi:hypothetical protein